jgi:hypothetical protein
MKIIFSLVVCGILFGCPTQGVVLTHALSIDPGCWYQEPPEVKSGQYDLIIITPEEFSGELEPLKEHKERHGITTRIITLTDISTGVYFSVQGRDAAEQLKYFIKDAKEQWGSTYVLLVGNEQHMPTRYSYAYNFTWNPDLAISDLYYADLYDAQGNFSSWDTNMNNKFGETTYDHLFKKTMILDEVDLYPDVHIGRLPCATSSEVDIVVSKIIAYEEHKANESWFKRMILFGGNDFSFFAEAITKFYDIIFRFNYQRKPAFEGEFLCNKVADMMNDFEAEKIYASSLLPFLQESQTYEKPTVENINKAINDGAGFILFVGHGTPNLFGTYLAKCIPALLPSPSGYNISALYGLENKEKLPVIVMNACSCGDFSGSCSPIAWEFVKLDTGGSIATFAYSSYAWADTGSRYPESKAGYLALHLFKAYADGKDTLGELLTSSITDYLNDVLLEPDPYDMLFIQYALIERLTLFGDPSLKIGGYPTTTCCS